MTDLIENQPENQRAISMDALIVQLSELNARGRWYSAQLWQLPFAYIGVTAVSIGQGSGLPMHLLALLLVACSIFGVAVLFHFQGVIDGERRATQNVQMTELLLGLPPTAKAKMQSYVRPLQLFLSLLVIAYGILGIYMLFV